MMRRIWMQKTWLRRRSNAEPDCDTAVFLL